MSSCYLRRSAQSRSSNCPFHLLRKLVKEAKKPSIAHENMFTWGTRAIDSKSKVIIDFQGHF